MSKKGYIYVMTNISLHGEDGEPVVKIGYANDVEQRRKQLSTTALPTAYHTYATYEVSERLNDATLHKMIDKLNPALRINANREFYYMTAKEAANILEAIATISGTKNKFKICEETREYKKDKDKISAPFSFTMIGLKKGDVINFRGHKDVKCKVVDAKKVEYNGELFSLSSLAQMLLKKLEKKKWKAVPGPHFFEYRGELLSSLRNGNKK